VKARFGSREQAGPGVAGGLDPIERLVVAPLGPGAVETADRPPGGRRSGRGAGRGGQERQRGGGSADREEVAAGEERGGARVKVLRLTDRAKAGRAMLKGADLSGARSRGGGDCSRA